MRAHPPMNPEVSEGEASGPTCRLPSRDEVRGRPAAAADDLLGQGLAGCDDPPELVELDLEQEVLGQAEVLPLSRHEADWTCLPVLLPPAPAPPRLVQSPSSTSSRWSTTSRLCPQPPRGSSSAAAAASWLLSMSGKGELQYLCPAPAVRAPEQPRQRGEQDRRRRAGG
eukprot:61270-Hanusia_phi.AAC.3